MIELVKKNSDHFYKSGSATASADRSLILNNLKIQKILDNILLHVCCTIHSYWTQL